VNEVHEVQQLPVGGDTAGTMNTAGCELGGCSIDRQRMALKLPLRHAEVPAANKRGLFAMDGLFYAHGSKLLLAEHKSLTILAGKHGFTRSYGYGIPTFTLNGHEFEVRGLLLELCELGSLQQQLVPQDGVYVPMSAGEAWEMIVSVACALKAVHVDAKHVFEDLKPANICLTKAPGKLEFKLIDFSSCQPLLAPNNLTRRQAVGGTLGYMAPEAAGGLEHTESADTYSLGEQCSAAVSFTRCLLVRLHSVVQGLVAGPGLFCGCACRCTPAKHMNW
jgi:serine/threonine protein kinase